MTARVATGPARIALPLIFGAVLMSLADSADSSRPYRFAGCGSLCFLDYWEKTDAGDAAAALAGAPTARPYRKYMLELAVESENAGGVAALLRAGAPPNGQKDLRDNEYIVQEAARRSGELVSLLLKAGAFPSVADHKTGRTPLHEAVAWNRVGAVAALLKAGADPRTPDRQGLTPLDLVQRHMTKRQLEQHRKNEKNPCPKCKSDILALLLAPPAQPPQCGRLCEIEFWHRATEDRIRIALAQAPAGTRWRAPGGSPLHLAIAAGAKPETVKLLLDRGLDPNSRDFRDDTPLHVAARTPGSAESVALLLKRGALPEALNKWDRTPLHMAAKRAATLDSMRLLLDAGADPDAPAGTSTSSTPRSLAVLQPEGSRAAATIWNYGDFDETDIENSVGLFWDAARSGHPDTVEFLLKRVPRPEHRAYWSTGAIHDAASNGNAEVLRVLLKHGADPNAYSYKGGGVPLFLAAGYPAAVSVLLEAGAFPDGYPLSQLVRQKPGGAKSIPFRLDPNEATPLHRAAARCAGASLRLLLAHGADPNILDLYGLTPLHRAVRRLANSKNVVWRKKTWFEHCATQEKENGWDLDECMKVQVKSWEEEEEQREECTTNIPLLIEHGADPSIKSASRHRENITPLEMARRRGLSETVIGLLKARED